MDYHGINMKGPFIGQRVSSLPTWTSGDIGRTVYLNSNNKRYYANNVGWVEPEVDNIWTYQDTAPTGWSIIAGTSDALLACKGGARSYNTTGETQAGTWTQPDHTLTEVEMPSHLHAHRYNLLNYDSGGSPVLSVNNGTGSYNTGSTGGDQPHSHGNEHRPLANIGIVISRD